MQIEKIRINCYFEILPVVGENNGMIQGVCFSGSKMLAVCVESSYSQDQTLGS